MRQQPPKWYRGHSRTYLNPRQMRDARRARKLRAELKMPLPPETEAHTGLRGGCYVARGRLMCRSCGHQMRSHMPKGCAIKGCGCLTTYTRGYPENTPGQ